MAPVASQMPISRCVTGSLNVQGKALISTSVGASALAASGYRLSSPKAIATAADRALISPPLGFCPDSAPDLKISQSLKPSRAHRRFSKRPAARPIESLWQLGAASSLRRAIDPCHAGGGHNEITEQETDDAGQDDRPEPEMDRPTDAAGELQRGEVAGIDDDRYNRAE